MERLSEKGIDQEPPELERSSDDQALKSERPGFFQKLFNAFREADRRSKCERRIRKKLRQFRFALFNRQIPKILAVEPEQIESSLSHVRVPAHRFTNDSGKSTG